MTTITTFGPLAFVPVAKPPRWMLCAVASVFLHLGLLWGEAWLARAPSARAEEPKDKSAQTEDDSKPTQAGDVTGVEEPGRERSDTARAAADVLLWVPREFVELSFLLSGAAAGLVEDQQLVPRVDNLINPKEGEIHVFPTLFAETRVPFNVGARVVARAGRIGSSVRVGFGGVEDLSFESRLHIHTSPYVPGLLTIEALHDSASSQEYRGVGNDPVNDPRNTFLGAGPVGTYREFRERFILGFGTRPYDGDVELFLSTSLSQRRSVDSSEENTLSAVFAPDTVPGFGETERIIYSEFDARFDSRSSRQGVEPGVLAEGYAGYAVGVVSTSATYLRAGARTAGYFPVMKRTNVISPKLVVDVLQPLEGDVPFNFTLQQPDFRGPIERTDETSVVASLDYQWRLAEFMAARVFVDGATVAPSFSELAFDRMTYAVGLGLDAFGDQSLIGSTSLAFNHEGVRFTLRLGLAPIFGDRQHRQ